MRIISEIFDTVFYLLLGEGEVPMPVLVLMLVAAFLLLRAMGPEVMV